MQNNPLPENLNPIFNLLNQAVSGTTTQSHKQIYDHISQIETQPTTYTSLAFIISQPNAQVPHNIKKMAIIVLKTALKRNAEILEFNKEQFENFRKMIVELPIQDDHSMEKAKRVLVSTLVTWDRNLDFMILEYLLSMVNSNDKKWQINGLEIMKMVFEDLKFQTQNIETISSDKFLQFVDLFTQSFATKFQQGDTDICALCLQCMNLILHHIPRQSPIVSAYTESYIQPLLSNPTNQSLKMRTELLQGLIQIIQINNRYIINNPNLLSLIINEKLQYDKELSALQSPQREQYERQISQIKKNWLSLLLDLIIADTEEEHLVIHMETIIKKVIGCLMFTKDDEKQLEIQLQEQINPYHYEQQGEDFQQDEEFRTSWSYTPRKLAILCFGRLITSYSQNIWNTLLPHLDYFLKSHNFIQRQLGILLLGIIFQNMEDHLQYLEHNLPIITESINIPNYPVFVKCTSLWAISKIAYLIVRQPVVQYQIQKQLLTCLSTQNIDLRVKNNLYLTIDQLVTNLEHLPKLMNQLIVLLGKGLEGCSGKSLYSVLKVFATLFQRHSSQISEEIAMGVIQKLCQKWNQHSSVQSMMCPLIECLVSIVASKGQCFQQFGPQIFLQSTILLQKLQHQKQLMIRIIDLLSALIALKLPQIIQWVSQDGNFHTNIIYTKLLNSSEQEIVNFTYGLIGDICKCTPMNIQYAQSYFKIIGNALLEKQNKANKTANVTATLTFSSNSLTCLTDLLAAHPELAQKNNYEYGRMVIETAVRKLSINNLSKIYAFNFARVFGRVGKIIPEVGSQYIENTLMSACIGLRANEHSSLTDQAYEGFLKMCALNPQKCALNFEYLVDSFMCYPCGQENVKNIFMNLLRSFRCSLSDNQWRQFLSKPIFLPAVARKIDSLLQNSTFST